MTLEQLRIFVAVAEREHVTRAARDLHLTQSATSAAVAALEERYATRLFDRIGRRIALTDGGRMFLVEARAVLARAAAAETALSDLAGLKRGHLTIAASQTIGNYWLPPVLQRFREAYPDVTLALTIGNTAQVAALMAEAAADLGFVEGVVDDGALAVRPIAEDEMILVVSPSHPWATRGAIAASDLTQSPWILREKGSGTRELFEAALRGFGLGLQELDVALELPSNEAVRATVVAGGGATVISRVVAAMALRAGSLVEVGLILPRRQFSVLRHKERHVTKIQQALLDLAMAHRPA